MESPQEVATEQDSIPSSPVVKPSVSNPPKTDSIHPITVNGNTLIPVQSTFNDTSSASIISDASNSDFILIQTKAPISEGQRQQLENLAVGIGEYVSTNTYLCRYMPSDLEVLRSLEFVLWVNVYESVFVLPPELKSTSEASGSRRFASFSTLEATHEVDVILHQGVEASSTDVKQAVGAAAHLDPESLTPSGDKYRLAIPTRFLSDVAKVDPVYLVEPVVERRLYNNRARSIIAANNINVNNTSYRGEGQIVAVADSGFDTGDIIAHHSAFTGRIRRLFTLTDRHSASDPHGHGTHVCGSIAGDGVSPSMGDDPSFRVRGVAPKATLMVQSLLGSRGGLAAIPINLNELFQQVYAEGASIHNNSWGVAFPGKPYNKACREIDQFVCDNPDMVICFAAGNDGDDADGKGFINLGQVGSEAAAKNCISVGASENGRPEIPLTYGNFGFSSEPLVSDLYADNPVGMAAFSSRGPTREGRIKPDIVAPGSGILSTRSSLAHDTQEYGSSRDLQYMFMAGTSVACPLVAGCVAILRETLILLGSVSQPPAALTKALLINGARNLVGQYNPSEAGMSPNYHSGWGLVNLRNSVAMVANLRFRTDTLFHTGSTSVHAIENDQVGKTFKITLVWTDPPGPHLQNDLDLIVRCNHREFHGNKGETTEEFDRVNNVEQVRWYEIPAGPIDVTVTAFALSSGRAKEFSMAWALY